MDRLKEFEVRSDLIDGSEINLVEFYEVNGDLLKCEISLPQYSMNELKKKNGGIGYLEYESLIYSLTREPYEYKFQFEDIGVDYSNFTSFDIFLTLRSKDNIHHLLDELSFLFGGEISLYKIDEIELAEKSTLDDVVMKLSKLKIPISFIDLQKSFFINSISIENIKEILMKSLFLKKAKERKPANDIAKKFIKMQNQINSKKEPKYDIISIQSSICCNKYCNETFANINKLTPYQIYNIYYNIEKIKKFDDIINGLYSGSVNKDDIDFSDISWINKI